MTDFYIGTAGWSYLRWDKEFYPEGLSAEQKLAFYATKFNAVELNNSFYHTPKAEQFLAWEAQVPKHFRFAVKASRYITHTKRLRAPEETVPRFAEALALRKKHGPVLFQLPPRFTRDLERLEQFLKQLPKGERYAIELRDPSWQDEAVYRLLRQHKVAFCLFDTPEGASPRLLTTDYAYVRLRGRAGRGLTPYLKEWRAWLDAHCSTAYVFFDNREEKRLAFGNALRLREIVET